MISLVIPLLLSARPTAASSSGLSGIKSVVSDGVSDCAVLTSGGVDCWGQGTYGQLGDGNFYTTGGQGSAIPESVLGVGGTGTLSTVSSIVAGGDDNYCALLISGGVDCWGMGVFGNLGNGIFYPYSSGNEGSAIPVQVQGVGGADTLSGVESLSGGNGVFCAVLTSGGVDCWGDDLAGQLGDGTFTNFPTLGSATPVQVVGVGGTGTLGGVASLADFAETFCAVLQSGSVDCWGNGEEGELGEGGSSGTQVDTPVQVVGVGGTGILSGISSLVGDGGFCGLLTSGGVDCWGQGANGELGGGTFTQASFAPVQVVGVGGTGTLSGVTSLTAGAGYCALLSSGTVVCWGYGGQGNLGNGMFYTTGNEGSASPVQVVGVGGSGTLSGVASVVSDVSGYCTLLIAGGVDCWGQGSAGDLGDGNFYTTGSEGNASPVQVVGVGGSGALSGVASVVGLADSYCTILNTGNLDCWGDGNYGQLGNDVFYTTGNGGSPIPVQVLNTPSSTILLPSNGATMTGTQVLDALSSAAASQVQYELSGGPSNLNDTVIATAVPTIYGWVAKWDSTTVPNGTYSLNSVGSYAGGVSATSPGITITVNNPPPSIKVVSPSYGATVTGTQLLDAISSATASQVQYELSGGPSNLNDTVIATAVPTIYGWVAKWDSTTVPNGTYTLNSVGSYAGGVSATSPGITMTVSN